MLRLGPAPGSGPSSTPSTPKCPSIAHLMTPRAIKRAFSIGEKLKVEKNWGFMCWADDENMLGSGSRRALISKRVSGKKPNGQSSNNRWRRFFVATENLNSNTNLGKRSNAALQRHWLQAHSRRAYSVLHGYVCQSLRKTDCWKNTKMC